MSLSEIPDRFRPKFCSRCGCRVVPGEKWNQFVCTNPGLKDGPHEHWIQSPHVAYVVIVDPAHRVCVVRRKIPPAIGKLCLPGGYVDFGDTPEESAIKETMDEANVLLYGAELEFLASFYEPGPGVTVMGFLAFVRPYQIHPFVEDPETSERLWIPKDEIIEGTLAFNGNWLAFQRARKFLPDRF